MTRLGEYLIEAIAKRKTGKYGSLGIKMLDCKTVDDLVHVLDNETTMVEKPRYIAKNRMVGTTSEYCKYLMARSGSSSGNGILLSMVTHFKDGLKRPLEHYNIYLVDMDAMKGYEIDLYDIPSKGEPGEGEIRWKDSRCTGVTVLDLEKMTPVRSLDLYCGAKEKIDIIETI